MEIKSVYMAKVKINVFKQPIEESQVEFIIANFGKKKKLLK